MKLIDGKKTAQDIRNEIKEEVAKMIDDGSRPPHLAAVIVGEDPASQTYVKSKEKQAKEVGFTSSLYEFPSDISEKELLQTDECCHTVERLSEMFQNRENTEET